MTFTFLRVSCVLAVAHSLLGTALAQPPDHDHQHGPPTPPTRGVPPVNRPKAKPAPKLPPNIVARVGSENITRDELLAMFQMVGGRPIVDQLVQYVLLEQEAKRLKVTVTAAELDKAIAEAKLRIVAQQETTGVPLTFKEIAEREGFNEDLIRWSVRLDILRRKTFAKAIEKKVPTRDGQMHLAHILTATVQLPKPGEQSKPLTPEEQKKKEEEAKTKIDGLLADIKAGRKTWDDAAKESDDPSNAQSGGDLGWMSKGQLDPDFEKAAFGIQQSGEIVGPVKSQFGWHLIKLIQKGSDLTAKEKADYRQQQLAMMQNNPQQMGMWMNSLRNGKTVVVNRQPQIVPGAKLPARMFQVISTTANAPAQTKSPTKTTAKKAGTR
ncbi:MAG: peptidylprolyl isomerase [Capsulimonadales bacterium]|nr:peptidylprolyl isomerase [Capsulimonadales bacterium]